MKWQFASLFVLAAALGSAQGIIFDTGHNNSVVFNGTQTNLGLSSGNLGGTLTERWYVQPIVIPAGGATINEVWVRGFVADVDPFTPAAFDSLNFRIFNRSGFTAPGSEVAFRTSTPNPGSQFAPVLDPRNSYEQYFAAPSDKRLFKLQGFSPVTLAAGDYYITVYASGPVNDSPQQNFAWFVGAPNDNVALNSGTRWRQANAAAGFQAFANAGIQATTFSGDPLERWNASVTLFGTAQRLTRTASGNVTFSDYAGNSAPYDDSVNFKPLDFLQRVAVVNPSNNQIIAFRYLLSLTQSPAAVDPNAFLTTMPYQYSIPAFSSATQGTVAFKFDNYLGVRNNHDLTLNSGDETRNWVLKNGDINADGEIGAADFSVLAAFYDQTGDTVLPGWQTWVDSAAGQADINEDGEVGAADFSILAANYDEVDE